MATTGGTIIHRLAPVLTVLLSAPAMAAEKGSVHIGLNNWTENIAVSNMWEVPLEGAAIRIPAALIPSRGNGFQRNRVAIR